MIGLLFERNPNPMWIHDEESLRPLAVNEAGVRQYGLPAAEFCRIGLAMLFREGDWPGFLDALRVTPTAPTDLGVWRQRRADGSEFSARLTVSSIEFEGWTARLVNVTEVASAERTVPERKGASALAQEDSAPTPRPPSPAERAALWEWDARTRTVVWGAGLARAFGHTLPESSADWWIEHIHPDDRDRVFERWGRFMASHEIDGGDRYRFQDAQGRYRRVQSVGYAIRGESGAIQRAVGLLTDQTWPASGNEPPASSEAAAGDARRWEALARASMEIHMLASPEATLRVVADRTREILGAGRAGIVWRRSGEWSDSLHVVSLPEGNAALSGPCPSPDVHSLYGLVCFSNRPVRFGEAELRGRTRALGLPDTVPSPSEVWVPGGNPLPWVAESPDAAPPGGWLAAPLIDLEGGNRGLIYASDHERGSDFTERDEALLVRLAEMATLAMQNALLMQTTQAEVDERRRVAEGLRESEQQYRSALRAARMGCWCWYPPTGTPPARSDGRMFRDAQLNALLRIGMTESHTSAREFLARVHPPDRKGFLRAARRALQTEGTISQDCRIRRPDGSLRWLRWQGRVVGPHPGEPPFLTGTALDITEQKALMEERNNLFEVSSILMVITDREGFPRQVNPAYTRTLGWTAEEAQITPYIDLVHREDREASVAAFERLLRGETIAGFTCRYRCKSGDYRWLVWNARLDPERGLVYATATDVTERRQEELRMRLLETAINNANDVVLITEAEPLDAPGPRIVYVNDAFERMTGYTRAEALGNTPRMLRAPDSDPEVLRRMRHHLERWEPVRVELKDRRKDGTDFWVELDIRPVADESGRHTHWIGIERDITERKDVEEALRESETRFRDLAESVPTVIWVTNAEGTATYLSARWTELTGLGVDRSLDMGWLDAVHPDDRKVLIEKALRAHLAQTAFESEYRLRRPDGGWRWVSANAIPRFSTDGTFLGLVGSLTDITTRKEAEQDTARLNEILEQRVAERTAQWERVNRELEAFSYSVSHDLRAPLRAVDGFSLALLEDYGDVLDEQGQQYLSLVRREAARMSELIDSLLSLSRMTRGEFHPEDVNLSELASEIIAVLQEREPHRRVTTCISPDLWAHGDQRLLRVLLENLLGNAWKFTDKKEQAEIAVGFREGTASGETGGLACGAAFFVRDNGAGFDMRFADRLFRPFQRLHRQDEFPGSGIGLATVQRVIQRHEGEVWAESEPGVGTTIFFTLPTGSGVP